MARALSDVVAENIRAYAALKELSLDATADFAGVSRRQLFNVLSGKHDATIGWLAKIAAALEVEPWQLLHPTATAAGSPTEPARKRTVRSVARRSLNRK